MRMGYSGCFQFFPVSAPILRHALLRVTRLNIHFTISIHNSTIFQQRSFSWLAEKQGLPFAGTKTY